MIKGAAFRGIGYKCAMLYFNNEQWSKALKEFSNIVNQTDPCIYEMMAKCYLRLGEASKHREFLALAMESYRLCGEYDKEKQIKEKLLVLA